MLQTIWASQEPPSQAMPGLNPFFMCVLPQPNGVGLSLGVEIPSIRPFVCPLLPLLPKWRLI